MSQKRKRFKPELELSAEEISKLFHDKGWIWDVGDECRSPSPGEIMTMLEILSELLDNTENPASVAALGRLVLYTDTNFPNHWGVFLELGYIPKGELNG